MSDEENDFVLVTAHDAYPSAQGNLLPPVAPQERTKIQKWLCPSEFASESSDYNKHLRSYVPHTGQWLRQSASFTQWHDNGGTLWVNGIPGSGKSVVAASLIRDFIEEEDVPVLYFFFRHANLANRTPKQMVRDWLSQLLEHSTLLQSHLKDLRKIHISQEDATFEELWDCLCSAAMAVRKIYCVADALDEMEVGNDWILPKLVDLGRQKPSTIKIITTSRQSPHIECVFKTPLIVPINLSRALIDSDIATYIDHQISKRPIEAMSAKDSQLIQSTVQSKAKGLFLYARLMIDEILPNAESTNIETLLDDLPTGVDDMYTTLLKEHSVRSGVPHELQVFILQWITHAFRPLRLLEVAELIRSVPLGHHLGGVQEIKDIVRSACGPLLSILPDETLQVIHHSFTEFLVNPVRTHSDGKLNGYTLFESEDIHRAAAITCIEYVIRCSSYQQRNEADCEKKPSIRDVSSHTRDHFFLEHPLLQYTISNWMVHASKLRACDTQLIEVLDRFLEISNDVFSYWQGIWHSIGQRAVRNTLTPLHVLAYFGLKDYIAELCCRNVDLDVMDSGGRTAVSYACELGHLDVLCLLLENGASSSMTGMWGITPLHYSCALNLPALVRRLLEAGANPLLETPEPVGRGREKLEGHQRHRNRHQFGINALELACTKGYLECTRTLLEFLEAQNYQPGPLHWAASGGQTEIVELLLQSGHVDPNLKDESGNTPLFLAASRRMPSTVDALLKAGALVNECSTGIDKNVGRSNYVRNKENSNSVSPLHAWACSRSHRCSSIQDMTDTALKLLGAGCDINAKDSEGKTPLFNWSRHSDMSASAFLKVLLDNGANPSAVDNLGNTPLHSIGAHHTEAHIKALVDAGGNINHGRFADGRTPLMCTFEGWNCLRPSDWHEYVQKYGVDPNAQDSEGWTVLHHSLRTENWDIEKIQVWLQAGANPAIQDSKGRHCLFSLRHPYYVGDEYICREKRLFEILIAAGLDIESTDHQGQNIILNAGSDQHLDYLKRLKGYGVKLMAKDYQGRTAMHVLASREVYHNSTSDKDHQRRLDCLNFFVDQGVSPNVEDHAGNTMFNYAIKNTGPFVKSSSLLIRTLLDVGVDPNHRNFQGRTALHTVSGLPAEHHRDYINCDGEKRLDLLLSPNLNMDVNLADHNGITPLHLASTRSAFRVSRLLSAGADIGAVDQYKRSVLHYAARAGNSNALGLVLGVLSEQSLQSLVDQRDRNGRTPLHDAIRSGALESVHVLLDSHANPHVRDIKGKTCLHIISEIGEEKTLKGLQHSSLRCSPPVRTRRGPGPEMPHYNFHPGGLHFEDPSRPFSPRGWEIDDKIPDVKDMQSISRAADIVKTLLKAGVDPSIVDNDGLSAYEAAVGNDCKEVACALSSDSRHDVARERSETLLPVALKRQRWNLEQACCSQLARSLVAAPEDATRLLIPAIIDTDESLVHSLLTLGADPLQANIEGESALDLAAKNGLLTVMRLLARKTQERQPLPSYLLHKAARREMPNLQMIKLLVELGVDINALEEMDIKPRISQEGDNKKSAAHILAAGEHWWQPVALDYLLEAGANTELVTSTGETALKIAIRGCFGPYGSPGFWRIAAIKALLKHNAKINYVDVAGGTPLIDATEENVEIVDILISHGADVAFGPSPPIGHAVRSLNVDVVANLIRAGADARREPLLLHIACTSYNSGNWRDNFEEKRQNAERIIELLLHNGANPHAILDDGTPLIVAVIKERGIIEPFLSARVDLNAPDLHGMTPFLTACKARQCRDILTRMIEAGADVLRTDHSGKNALHLAFADLRFGVDVEGINFLLANGLPVNALDNAQMTPLHYAIQRRSHGAIEKLLDARADVTILFLDNTSSLHIILPCSAPDGSIFSDREQFIPIVQRLIKAGADTEARDSSGNTPIFGYVAKQPTYDKDGDDEMNAYPDIQELCQVLTSYDLQVRNNAGETLLHVVAKRNRHVAGLPSGRDDTRDMFKLLWELGLDPKTEDGSQKTALDVAAACGNTGILDLFAPKP